MGNGDLKILNILGVGAEQLAVINLIYLALNLWCLTYHNQRMLSGQWRDP